MSNIVEIVLKLKDLLSGGMQQAATVSQQASTTMATASAASTVAITNQSKAVANLTKEYKVLGALPKGTEIKLAQAPLTKYGRDFTTVRDSIQGTIQKVHDAVTGTMTKASEHVGGFTGKMWEMAKTTANTSGSMVKHFFTHREAIGHVGKALGGLIGTTSIMDGIQRTTGISTDVLSLAQEGLNMVMEMNPIGFVVGAIIALCVWVKTLCEHNKYWGQSLKDLWGSIKAFAGAVGVTFKQIGETIWYWVDHGWLKLKSFVEYAVEALSRVGRSFDMAMSGDWKGAAAVFSTEIKTQADVQIAAADAKHVADQARYAKEKAEYMQVGKELAASTMAGIKYGWAHRKDADVDPTKEAAKAAELAKKKKATRPVSDKSNEITGGGGKNLTINIQELGNNMVLHTTNLKESAEEIGKVIRAEIIRVASSGASAAFGN